jgi:hypothetical protein
MLDLLRRAGGPLPLLVLVLAAGCSNSPDTRLVNASGRVVYKGRPLADIPLQFTPVDAAAGVTANGTTDAEGKFTLQTQLPDKKDPQPGAAPGDYKVTFNLYRGDPRVPDDYLHVETTTLTLTIPPGGSDGLTLTVK